MKLNLIIIPSKKFSEDDLYNFMDILDGKTYVANIKRNVSIGKYKSLVFPDFDINEIFMMRDHYFDRLIFLADEGFKEFINIKIAAIFTRYLNLYKTVILSTLAPIAFIKMNLLHGKKIVFNYEEFPEYLKIVEKYRAEFLSGYSYFVDKNLITVKGRETIYELGEDLLEIEKELKKLML